MLRHEQQRILSAKLGEVAPAPVLSRFERCLHRSIEQAADDGRAFGAPDFDLLGATPLDDSAVACPLDSLVELAESTPKATVHVLKALLLQGDPNTALMRGPIGDLLEPFQALSIQTDGFCETKQTSAHVIILRR